MLDEMIRITTMIKANLLLVNFSKKELFSNKSPNSKYKIYFLKILGLGFGY